MKNRFLKLISSLLVMVLLVNMLPLQIFAEEYQRNLTAEQTEESTVTPDATTDALPEETSPEDAYVVAEITENRTEYSKEFLMSNGLHMAAVYADPVHYETENGWEEIDNTLKTNTDGSYSNTAGIWDVTFPEQLGANESVTIEKDGYTLSFSMSGELQTGNGQLTTQPMQIGTASQPFAVTAAQTVTGVIQQKDTSAIEQAPHPEAVPDKLQSQIAYAEVYENTDIIYDLDSNTVKESMILESYDPNLQGYSYTLEVGTMIPVLEEDGSVTFYDEKREDIVMVMPAPYLIDGNGEHNYDIEVQFAGKDSTYILAYLLPTDWLAAENRAWPVLLDPVVQPESTTANIRDTTIFELEENQAQTPGTPKWYNTWGVIQVGYYAKDEGISRAFLKYRQLPEFKASDVIVNAEIRLCKPITSGESALVEVHKVNEVWESETITWAEHPSYNPNVEDYAFVQSEGYYGWIVTDIVRDWYTNENTGMMFKVSDEVESARLDNYKQFYSADYTEDDNYQPLLLIYFRNNNGLEGYWDYTSATAGRAGTGYVNNYTGNLVWGREDIGFGGNRMPVSVSHIYNLNDAANNSFGLGNGWRTNYHQRVYLWGENSDYYVWEDDDGTEHYFAYASENTYEDEDNLGMTLTIDSTSTEKYCIKDLSDNCSYFDAQGRLVRQCDNQETENSVLITYMSDDSPLIASVTDGAGRKYQFSYSEDNMLSRISYEGTGTSVLTYVDFEYDESSTLLTKITDKDGTESTFGYDANSLLTSAGEPNGYRLNYTYNSVVGASWKPYRVLSISETDQNTQGITENGGSLCFAYAHNQTTVTDHNENALIYQFNDYGNTVCVQDDEGRAQFAEYALTSYADATGSASSNAKSNQLRVSSELQYTAKNLMVDNNMHRTTLWSKFGAVDNFRVRSGVGCVDTKSIWVSPSTEEEDMGTRCGAQSTQFTLAEGETHTFSCYLRESGGTFADVYLMAKSGTTEVVSETITLNTTWKRLQVSYTNNTDTEQQVAYYILTEGNKPFYIDCVQLEEAATASHYNLINNGDFHYGATNAYGWSKVNCTTSDGVTTLTDPILPQLDENVFAIQGKPGTAKSLTQTVYAEGKANDCFTVCGWAKGNTVPLIYYEKDSENEEINTVVATSPREYAIRCVINYADGTTSEPFVAQFNPDVDNWQYTATGLTAERDYSSITVELVCEHLANTVYFDGIQLYKNSFGSSYQYDSKGNVTSVKDTGGQVTEYLYDQETNDLLQVSQDGNVQMEYTYQEDTHNVETATTSEDVECAFEYDDYGNNTAVSITDGASTVTGTSTYTDDGNYPEMTKDALGNETYYGYNADTGVLEWVQYPEDTENTRTEYTYDSMYRIATAACETNTGLHQAVSFAYADDLLTSIQTPSTTYGFAYGVFDLLERVSIGDRTLAAYTYTNDQNRYLSALDFGNGGKVQYAYDSKGRVIEQRYEDNTYIRYTYGTDGNLETTYDSATGITATYSYDYTGKLTRYEETGADHSYILQYSYDSEEKLINVVEILNGHDRKSTYTYDEEGQLSAFSKVYAGRTYTYDEFDRISSTTTTHQESIHEDPAEVFTTDYTFAGTDDASSSDQVSVLEHSGPNYDAAYSYTYDGNGNILTVSDGTNTTSYVYDSANQLIRENNQAGNFTHTWVYDAAGNVLTRNEYTYTTGELGEPTDTVTYTYGDSQWGDLLTAYDGDTITYDQIGNPLSDGEWTYTWEHGRQLASMSNGTTTWEYSYNGDGLRTERTDGTTNYRYVYEGDKLTFMARNGLYLRFAYTPEGTPLSVLYKGTTYYYVTNLQGDVTAILSQNGYSMVEYTYDAWGNLLSITGPLKDSLGVYNPLRYRGYVYDQEAGLYYLESRYYSPEIGRFINVDSVEFLGESGTLLSCNLFGYCENNPVLYIDPSGCAKVTIILKDSFLRDVVTATAAALGTIIGAMLFHYTGAGAVIAGAIGAALGWIIGGTLSRRYIKKDIKFSVYIPWVKAKTYTVY